MCAEQLTVLMLTNVKCSAEEKYVCAAFVNYNIFRFYISEVQ